MYGLPSGFDGRFFVGQALVQVCVNENQLLLQFEQNTILTIEGEYSCGRASDLEQTVRKVPEFESQLLKLLGAKVTGASGASDGSLSLTFENALRVMCFDDPHYESYSIRSGQLEIIV